MSPSPARVGGTAVIVAAVGVVAARRIDARWAAADADDPCLPDHRDVPSGESHAVRTDDGAELAVTVAGEGPTVVLAHCWTGARAVWAPVAHRLVSAGHRVVLYDQRGHGESSLGADDMTIERLGADLRAVLEALDVRDAVLAGHSMGGMTVQSLVTHHPSVAEERARAIVLVATAASGLSRGRLDARAQRIVGSAVVERAMRSRVGHALVRGAVGRSVRRNHLTLTRDLFLACEPSVRSGWLSAMQAMDLREGIARVGVPTTIVVGTRDTLTPPSRADELARTIPGAGLVTLDGFGHMLPLEAPDEVADAIARVAVAAPAPVG